MNNTLKIIDFGTSTTINNKKWLTALHGTSYYIAPEVLNKKYNLSCDIWSVGVILYILLCGKPPFDGDNDEIIKHKVSTGKYAFNDPIWKHIS